MADSLIDFLTRTVHRLEVELATEKARREKLEAWCETLRPHYTEIGLEAEEFFQLMDGDFKGPGD